MLLLPQHDLQFQTKPRLVPNMRSEAWFEQHLKWVQGITLEELQTTIRQSIDNENIGLEDDEKTTIQDFMEQWLQ